MKHFLLPLLLLCSTMGAYAQSIDTLYLWPGAVPGQEQAKGPALISDNTDGDVTRIAEVSNPLLEVYSPARSNGSGAAVIVCPGGGYGILAIDLEGHEVARWLNELGYTAAVLQYRVPKNRVGALQDVQRAIRTLRSKAAAYGIDPQKLGVMGFSAGGSLSARAATNYHRKTYPAQDATDSLSSRPDFAMLLYPAYLDEGEGRTLTAELKVTAKTPPHFIFETADDPYGNSALVMTQALRNKKVPVELHMLPKGGHGYGLRPGNIAAETWPALAEQWLARQFRPAQ